LKNNAAFPISEIGKPGMPHDEIRGSDLGSHQKHGNKTDAFFQTKESVSCERDPIKLTPRKFSQRLPVLPKIARIDVKLVRAWHRGFNHRLQLLQIDQLPT
jgi:hypothetical protein